MSEKYPVFPTPINKRLIARLKGLQSLWEESEIEHPTSKGTLREQYLRDFLVGVLPPRYTVTNGFMCDLLGKVTPQYDIIVCDMTKAPGFALSDDQKFVPVESALLIIEVKSTLRHKHKDQIRKQIEGYLRLRPQAPPGFEQTEVPIQADALKNGEQLSSFVITSFVFAYNCEVSVDTLKQWVKKIEHLRGICILGGHYTWNAQEGIAHVATDRRFNETLIFLSGILHDIEQISDDRRQRGFDDRRRFEHWRRYIVGHDPERMR